MMPLTISVRRFRGPLLPADDCWDKYSFHCMKK